MIRSKPLRQRRRAILAAVLGTAMSLVAAPAGAAGQPADEPSRTAAVPNAAGQATGPLRLSTTLTLITGHVVRYDENQAGRATVTLVSAPPGADPVVNNYSDPTGVYVLPPAAEQLVNKGLVDRELFDVQYLAHNGYGDDRQDSLPVIVSYQLAGGAKAARAKTAAAAPALAGSIKRVDLESLHGAGLSVTKKQAPAFWSALTGSPLPGGPAANQIAPKSAPSTLVGGVRKVWLDRKVKVDLADSVPMIGAPEAWAGGYDGSGVKVAVLDTGIDDTHPDLAGKVAESRSFVPGVDTARDGHGHGTHVASTIVGSGAASGGARKGVAPAAQLIVGKVLSDEGSGNLSWIIDGMEWAAHSGARIVSMSLGSGPTDGSDAGSTAVNELTASTGTLFVIAAGNSGPGAGTVSAPGAADAALTVAMVSKQDELDPRSSRGPRLDGALKPDIAAPGVKIVAARAAGTSLGTPVDQYYTTATGTSMATPHVAGAAAVLAQQHPDWTAAELKSALMSTSKDDGYTVYEQGAGRLDLGRAFRQRVRSTTANADFGRVSPTDGTQIARQVTYANDGDQPVTLTLTPTLRRVTGEPAPAGALAADSTVTVPAGGTATVTVTVNPGPLQTGRYTGAVVATDAATGTRLTTPVGLLRQPPRRKVDIRIIGRPGEPLAIGTRGCTFMRVDDQDGAEHYSVLLRRKVGDPNISRGSGLVPEGVYNVECYDAWSERDSFSARAKLYRPEVTISGDTTFEWDLAKDVVPIRDVHTPLPSESVQISQGYSRTTASGATYVSTLVGLVPYGLRMYVTPSDTKATIGSYRFFFEQLRAAPEAATTVHGRGTVRVRPVYVVDSESVPKFPTNQRLRLATKEDLLAGRDVRGKLVVVDSEPSVSIWHEVDLATQAGAAGVLNHVVGENSGGYGTPPLVTKPIMDALKIPVLWLDRTQWAQVEKVLDGAHRPTVDIRSQLVSPYEYHLRFYEYGRIPARLDYAVNSSNLVTRHTEYHAQFPTVPRQPNTGEANHTFSPGDTVSFNNVHYFDSPTIRTDYYTVTGSHILWARNVSLINRNAPTTADLETQSFGGFSTPGTGREVFNQGPTVPGTYMPGPEWTPDRWISVCPVCRQGDKLYVYLAGGIPANDREKWMISGDTKTEFSLSRDGMELPLTPEPIPSYALAPEPATYTLHTVHYNGFSGFQYGKTVRTDWTFQSGHVDTDNVTDPYLCLRKFLGGSGACGWQPLILLNYGLDLGLDDTARAGKPFSFTVNPWQPDQAHPAPIADVRVSVSYDDGAHWTKALVRKESGDTFRVLVTHPRLDRTTGAVSIRTEVSDTAGNTVTQQIDRAYGLTDAHGGTGGHRPVIEP